MATFEQQINNLSRRFMRLAETPKYHEGIWWVLMRGHGTTKEKSTGLTVYRNAEAGDADSSLELLTEEVRSEYENGEKRLHVRIYPTSATRGEYDTVKLDFTGVSPTASESNGSGLAGIKTSDSLSFLGSMVQMNNAASQQLQQQLHEKDLELERLRAEQRERELEARIESIESSQKTFLDRLEGFMSSPIVDKLGAIALQVIQARQQPAAAAMAGMATMPEDATTAAPIAVTMEEAEAVVKLREVAPRGRADAIIQVMADYYALDAKRAATFVQKFANEAAKAANNSDNE